MRHDDGKDTDRPEIDRRDLRVLLLESFPDEFIKWGVKVDRVQKGDDGRMAVHFSDGTSETGFRLVVGADGAWSKARSLVSLFPITCKMALPNTWTGHICHPRVRRQILLHIQHLTKQPLLPHRRGESRHRKLPQYGRQAGNGSHATRRPILLHIRRSLTARKLEERQRCSHRQPNGAATETSEGVFLRLAQCEHRFDHSQRRRLLHLGALRGESRIHGLEDCARRHSDRGRGASMVSNSTKPSSTSDSFGLKYSN